MKRWLQFIFRVPRTIFTASAHTAINWNVAKDTFKGDLRGDGNTMTNLAEYIAGTDPQDQNSYLKVDTISRAGSTVLTFRALANKGYTVRFTDDLRGGTWQKLTDVLPQAADRIVQVTDPSPEEERYYRLATPPLP